MWFIQLVKNLPTNYAGNLGSIPGLGRSLGEGKSCPLQYSGLENSMDCIVHGVVKSQTGLSDFHFTSCWKPKPFISSCPENALSSFISIKQQLLKRFIFLKFSSDAQLCPTLCDPIDCSTPGFPIHRQLLELAQTHAHRVGDAIQLSYPLLPPSPAFNLSQHQGLF